MRRIVFRHDFGSRIAEADLIEATVIEWRDSPEAQQPDWSVVLLSDGTIRALRLPTSLRDIARESLGVLTFDR